MHTRILALGVLLAAIGCGDDGAAPDAPPPIPICGTGEGLADLADSCGTLSTSSVDEVSEWDPAEVEAFLDCLEGLFVALETPSCGTLEAETRVPRSAEPVPYVASTVAAAWIRLFDRDWVAVFSARDLTVDGYPNLLFLVRAEVGEHTSRRGEFWPVYNDPGREVWTAVPVVGLPGTITITSLEPDRIAGTFEFDASLAGFVPPREVGTVRSGRFETAFVADLRPR